MPDPSSHPHPCTPTSTPVERLHAVDALRALAMFLGVVLHAALGFMATDNPFTPRMDRSRWAGFDGAVFWIHEFRMQLFFVVAGMFTALLLGKRTPGQFLRGRMVRLGLPLLFSVVTVLPLTISPFLLAMGVPVSAAALVSTPAHLWFLVVLSNLSTQATIFVAVANKWPAASRAAMRIWSPLAACAGSRWACLILCVPAALLTLTMHTWTIEAPEGWLPPWPTLIYYEYFFLVGWAVQRCGVVASVGRGWPWLLGIGNCIVFPALLVVGPGLTPKLIEAAGTNAVAQRLANFPAEALQAVFGWTMILGLFGAFRSYCVRERRWLRWLADSSYWVYLVHLPAVYWLQYCLAGVGVPGMSPGPFEACIKFVLVVTVATVFSLATYAALIRPTRLDRVVGGSGKAARVGA